MGRPRQRPGGRQPQPSSNHFGRCRHVGADPHPPQRDGCCASWLSAPAPGPLQGMPAWRFWLPLVMAWAPDGALPARRRLPAQQLWHKHAQRGETSDSTVSRGWGMQLPRTRHAHARSGASTTAAADDGVGHRRRSVRQTRAAVTTTMAQGRTQKREQQHYGITQFGCARLNQTHTNASSCARYKQTRNINHREGRYLKQVSQLLVPHRTSAATAQA